MSDEPRVVEARDRAGRYVVVGHYCATDENPDTDAEPEETAVVCETREDAEGWLDWYPYGRVVPVRDDESLAAVSEPGGEPRVHDWDCGCDSCVDAAALRAAPGEPGGEP